MAKQDSGGSAIIPVLLIGGAAYLAYQWFFAPATTAAQASATPTPTTPTMPQAVPTTPTPSVPTPTAPAQSAYNSLDQIYQRFSAIVQQNVGTDPALTNQNGQITATTDVFNYYLGQVGNYNLTAAGLTQEFGTQNPLTLAQFWSGASAWLAQNQGLSGIGGRGFAGYIVSRRRRR